MVPHWFPVPSGDLRLLAALLCVNCIFAVIRCTGSCIWHLNVSIGITGLCCTWELQTITEALWCPGVLLSHAGLYMVVSKTFCL